jgi:hypothetical protein
MGYARHIGRRPRKPKELAAGCFYACFRQCCVETPASEAEEVAVQGCEVGRWLVCCFGSSAVVY